MPLKERKISKKNKISLESSLKNELRDFLKKWLGKFSNHVRSYNLKSVSFYFK
jgi:hypothetical protein